ncbi:MAG: helix-turn-helix domain-containing protein [Alloprevotella sp.]
MADLNRIKTVLAERGIMSKTLHKDPATVSKWCNNHAQPDLKTLAQIAEVLNVDIHELICHTKVE